MKDAMHKKGRTPVLVSLAWEKLDNYACLLINDFLMFGINRFDILEM